MNEQLIHTRFLETLACDALFLWVFCFYYKFIFLKNFICVNYLWLRLKTGYAKENLHLSLSGDWGLYQPTTTLQYCIEVFHIT